MWATGCEGLPGYPVQTGTCYKARNLWRASALGIWEYSGKKMKPGKVSNAAEKYSETKLGVPLGMKGQRTLITSARWIQ